MIKLISSIIFFCSFTHAQESAVFANLENKINESIADRAQLTVEKNELEKQISELQEKIKERKILILKRLRAINKLKSFQWGELLVNSNLNELNRNLKIMQNLSQYDMGLFKEYAQSFAMLAQARKNLTETEKQIQSNINTYQTRLAEFRKLEEIRISNLLNSKSDSLLLQKGKLPRPLEGKPAHEFGNVRDHEGQYYLINYGELYGKTKNSSVHSVGPGVVIFRDELTRWHETLIVEHSDDYYSVYAGVANSKKKVGDRVAAAEIIGSMSGNEFYFELRHFANAINPQKWFEGNK